MNKGRQVRKLSNGSWLTLAFLVLTLSMLAATFGLSRPSAWVPRVVLSATLALLLWQWVAELRAAPGRGVEPGGKRAQAAIAWIGALLGLAWVLGAAVGSAVFCLCWLRWHASEGWLRSLVVASILGLFLWVFFGLLPGTVLYPGVVLRLLA